MDDELLRWLASFKLQLWQWLRSRLDPKGRRILALYDQMSAVLMLAEGRQLAPDADVNGFVEEMKSAFESLGRSPSNAPIPGNPVSGPGGTRTHDPHNADVAERVKLSG